MSPQAAAVSSSVQSHRVSLVESDNSFIASLIEAADEAYQKTSDEFASSAAAQVHAGPGRLTTAATSGGRPRFNLRKRKAVAVSVNTGTSCAGSSLSAVNSAFLSGLFADLQQTSNTSTSTTATATNHDAYDDGEEHYVTDGESCPGTPVPSPKKRARLGRSLSRCTKSYASLSVLASATYNSTDSYVGKKFSDQTDMAPSAGTAQGEPAAADEPTAAPTVSAATSTTSTASASTVASDVLADSLSAAAALADAIFPHLPATVSESPLRKTSSSKMSPSSNHSADLTAQPASSTEASPTTEAGATTLHVKPEKELTLDEVFAPTEEVTEGPASAAVTPTDADEDLAAPTGEGEDSYGWFLALDHDVDASEEHITDAYRAAGNESSSAALAFQAPVSAAAGCAARDAEVEWAKAADTVDDVLGDLPF